MKFWFGKPLSAAQLGKAGEVWAFQYLAKQGYKILERNFRCRLGEIDAVCEKKGRIVFVEIKTRSNVRFGYPEEAVHPGKQRKIIQTAKWYLKEKHREKDPVSFAVLSLRSGGAAPPEVRFLENAFYAPETD